MPHPSRREAIVYLGTTAVVGAAGSHSSAAQPAKERIKIGQIGVGHAHATKLSVYRESPEYEVVGVVEPDAELRKQAENAPAYRGLKWLSREQLLETPGLRAVLVETRVPDLLDNAEACVAAGMHVHIDKPAGESLPQFQRILAAAAGKNSSCRWGTCTATTRRSCCCASFSRRAGSARCSKSTPS